MKKTLTIKAKIWIGLFIGTFLSISCIVALTFYLYQELYVQKQIDALLTQGNSLAEAYNENGETETFLNQVDWLNDSAEADIVYTNNPMLLSGAGPIDPYMGENIITFDERQQLLDGQTVTIIREHARFDQNVLGVAIPLQNESTLSGVIFLYLPLADVYEPFEPILWLVVFVVAGFLLTILLIANRASYYVVKPIQQLEAISFRMASGDFSERIELSQKDELGKLADSFNAMSQSLKEVDENRKSFLANVAHELRTPLSYIKGYTEALEEGAVDAKNYFAIISKETNRLERLVHDLLDLAHLEGASFSIKEEPIAFSQLILDVRDRFALMIREKQLTVHLNLDEDVIIKGDSDRLEQVMTNVIDNAIRYTPEGNSISLSLTETNNIASITIQDTGIGIPPDEITRITDRFYRVNKARTRQDGGSGLGLAITQQIIHRHNGTLTIQSETGKGTTITITLPTYT